MDLIIQLGIATALLIAGIVFGRANEKRHYRSIQEREAQLRDVLVFNERRVPPNFQVAQATFVAGSVVIAEDYFKRVASALKSLVGGKLTAYESLLDRGRREAILRMKQEAKQRGARMVFNVRLETAQIAGERPNEMFAAEFIAYGTALVPAKRA